MSLSLEEVEHIAKLARLELSKDESEDARVRLSSILDYVSKLQETDTTGIEPLNYVATLENVWGQDEVQGALSEQREIIVEDFPDKESDLLRVKGVFS